MDEERTRLMALEYVMEYLSIEPEFIGIVEWAEDMGYTMVDDESAQRVQGHVLAVLDDLAVMVEREFEGEDRLNG